MPHSNKLLDPKNDIAFKRIFGTENNKDILIEFLNDMLVFKGNPIIKDVTFLPTIQIPEISCQKTSIVDVLCEDTHGAKYVVEMQMTKSMGFVKRAQFYAAKAYSSQAKVGSDYNNLKEVVFIAIADYIVFPDKDAIKSDHVVLDKATFEQDLKDFSFTFLELPKFKRREDELKELTDKIDLWCYFFKYAPDADATALNEILKQSIPLQKAMTELNCINWSEKELTLYDEAEKRNNDHESGLKQRFHEGMEKGLEEGLEKGREEGEAIGMEKGREEQRRLMVIEMLKNKIPDDAVITITKITPAELGIIKTSLAIASL